MVNKHWLKLNMTMDDNSWVAAGLFVDELKSLGVLVPATEELRANCPLFCVDKPFQPGQKRCIADMKYGGQNWCMGKGSCLFGSERGYLTSSLSRRLFGNC
jgi:hypothetical protein